MARNADRLFPNRAIHAMSAENDKRDEYGDSEKKSSEQEAEKEREEAAPPKEEETSAEADEVEGVPWSDLLSDYRFYSEKITVGVRTIAFAMIAGVWAILTADNIALQAAGLGGLSTDLLVRLVFIIASVTLLVDVLHYLAAFELTNLGMKKWEKREAAGQDVIFYYNEENVGRLGTVLDRAQSYLFYTKIFLALAGALAFIAFAFAITFSEPADLI
jgi:hypothetical protein